MGFRKADKLKALAIVRVFETGKAEGDYAAFAVLDDGAGASYGINQFTHRSGSLLDVIRRYLANGGVVGSTVIENRLRLLRSTTAAAIEELASDAAFKKALIAAAATREMREAQDSVAFERYLRPAILACEGSGFITPMSLAVIYDSMTHGSYERIRDMVRVARLGVKEASNEITPEGVTAFEKHWISEYVRRRHTWLLSIARLRATAYRTRFFLVQMLRGNWNLDLPLKVHGVNLTSASLGADEPDQTANGPDDPPEIARSGTPQIAPPEPSKHPEVHSRSDPALRPRAGLPSLDDIEAGVDRTAAKYDQAERIANTVLTRADSAKSLWTTVAGTLWQTAWAFFGLAAGIPREVWLVVAVIAASLMLGYLYRQIALGKIRELGKSASSRH